MNAYTRRLVLALVAALALAGCRASLPADEARGPCPTDDNASLVEYIVELPLVTAEPAYRAVYMIWKDAEYFDGGYDDLQRELEAAGIIDPAWNLAADQFVDRATVGYMLARACQVKTGLNWQLLGMGRYAYRELVYRGVAQPAGELSWLSGGEFSGMITLADRAFLRNRKDRAAQADLGPEPR